MPLPGLLPLVLISFVCGAAAALLTGRRRSAFTGTALALAAGLAAPWAGAALGYRVESFWMLVAAIAAGALFLTGLAALLPSRRRGR
jgi:hypothetical protein